MPPVADRKIANHVSGVSRIIFFALVLSGMTAISYEIIWQRLLVRITGATLPAVSQTFCVFIAGLWVGSVLSIPLLKRYKTPLKLYAFVELGVAAFGILVPIVFGTQFSTQILNSISNLVPQSTSSSDAELTAALVQHAVCYLVLFVPTVLMGITFNCVTAHVDDVAASSDLITASLSDVRRELSMFYAANLSGGCLACVFVSFWLIPNVGLSIASMSMALINLVVFFLLMASSLLRKPNDDPFAQLLAMFSPPKIIQTQAQTAPPIETGAPAGKTSAVVSPVAADGPTPGWAIMLIMTLIISGSIMALEVCYTRLMLLLFGSSTYSISGVLLMAFLGFTASSVFVAKSSRSNAQLASYIPKLIMAASLLIAGGMWLVQYVPVALLAASNYLDMPSIDPFVAFLLPRLTICGAIVLPPVAALGALFPVLLAVTDKYSANKTANESSALSSAYSELSGGGEFKRHTVVGMLLAASSLGSVAGSLIAGLALIPHPASEISDVASKSGIETALSSISLFLLLLAVSMHTALRDKDKPMRAFVIGSQFFMFCCMATGYAILFRPPWDLLVVNLGPGFFHVSAHQPVSQQKLVEALRTANGGRSEPVFYREGANSTVSVEQNTSSNVRYLKTNGKIEAALPIDWRKAAPTADAATQILLGCLPFYFLDKKQDVNALIIGYGSGITTGAVDCRPETASIKVAELEPSVYKASKWFVASNLDPFRSARKGLQRVFPLVVDGRAFLRVHKSLYDVIISQPSEPWISGASDLFTDEFFKLAKSRLTKNGVLCQWLQLYAIDQQTLKSLLATFADAFPDCYLVHPSNAGEILLIGINKDDSGTPTPATLDVDLLNKFLKQNGQYIAPRLSPTSDNVEPPVITCDFVLGPDRVKTSIAGARLNTDDRLSPEYSLPAMVIQKDDLVSHNLQWLNPR